MSLLFKKSLSNHSPSQWGKSAEKGNQCERSLNLLQIGWFPYPKHFVCFITESTYREYITKMLKTLKSRQLERAAGSQAACTFKYATLWTGETDDTVTLKKQDDG